MKPSWISKWGLVVLFSVSVTARAFAFLGFADIVFDPSVYAQAVQQVIRLEQQYGQLVRSYQMLRSEYDQLVWNANRVPVNMAARYRAAATHYLASAILTMSISNGL